MPNDKGQQGQQGQDGKAVKADAALQERQLTAAAVASMVFTEEPIFDEDGEPTGKTRKVTPLQAADVFAWKDHGTHINVVSTAGQKYRVEKR